MGESFSSEGKNLLKEDGLQVGRASEEESWKERKQMGEEDQALKRIMWKENRINFFFYMSLFFIEI